MPSRPGMRNRLKTTLPMRFGQDFVASLDGRCRLSREVREPAASFDDRLRWGNALSHQQRSMCKRAIWLELMVEHEEARIGEAWGSRRRAARAARREPGLNLPATWDPARGSGGSSFPTT